MTSKRGRKQRWRSKMTLFLCALCGWTWMTLCTDLPGDLVHLTDRKWLAYSTLYKSFIKEHGVVVIGSHRSWSSVPGHLITRIESGLLPKRWAMITDLGNPHCWCSVYLCAKKPSEEPHVGAFLQLLLCLWNAYRSLQSLGSVLGQHFNFGWGKFQITFSKIYGYNLHTKLCFV